MGLHVTRIRLELEAPGEAPQVGYGYSVSNGHFGLQAIPFDSLEEREQFEGAVARLSGLGPTEAPVMAGALAATRWSESGHHYAAAGVCTELTRFHSLGEERIWALDELVARWELEFDSREANALVEELAGEAEIALTPLPGMAMLSHETAPGAPSLPGRA